ncbi:MAG: transcriptional repressor LexA, partial [Pseudomonadota bacterium]
MLTAKQQQLLFFLHHRLTETGISPSFEEMKDALGLRSKSGIHRLISALEERGFIRRMPNRARALEVLRLPAGMVSSDIPSTGPVQERPERRAFTPNVIHGNFGDVIAGRPVAEAADAVQLPLYGRIAAGTPIEALRDNETFAEVPVSMLGTGEHYALEVAGDSMIEAGIFDGDTVIIERCDVADTGTIIVAL